MTARRPAPLTLESLRAFLAPRLADSVLHELRNPLNALTLQCDLLRRTLENPNAAEGAALNRVAQMRERLKDLHQRQNGMARLWLAKASAEPMPVRLAELLEETVSLLRSYCAQREMRLNGKGFAALDGVTIGAGAVPLQLVLIAVVVCACSRLQAAGAEASAGELTIEVMIPTESASTLLELAAPLAGAPTFGELGYLDSMEFCAALAAITLPHSIEITALPGDHGLRLKLPRQT